MHKTMRFFIGQKLQLQQQQQQERSSKVELPHPHLPVALFAAGAISPKTSSFSWRASCGICVASKLGAAPKTTVCFASLTSVAPFVGLEASLRARRSTRPRTSIALFIVSYRLPKRCSDR